MVSRRTLLGATGAGAFGALGGCLTRVGLAKTGYLQNKIVVVEWGSRARRQSAQILYLGSDGESEIDGRVAQSYRDVVDGLTHVTVSDDDSNRLRRRFDDVKYVIGFCGHGFDPSRADGCLTTVSSRNGFNRVQFGDRAEVRVTDDRFGVLDVYEGAQGDPKTWKKKLHTFDLDEVATNPPPTPTGD